MTPFAEAQKRANEIAILHLAGMFVTISLGGEYTDSTDVEAKMGLAEQVQSRLNALGYGPLKVDGQIGPATLKAILAALG